MSPITNANRHRDHQRETSVAEATQSVNTPFLGVVFDTQCVGTAAYLLGARAAYRAILADVVGDRSWVGSACVARPRSGKQIGGFLCFLGSLGLATPVWKSPMAGGEMKVNLDALVVRESTCLVVEGGIRELCIVGPDSDYYVLAELCRQRGVMFTVAGFPASIGSFMRAQADRVIELGEGHLLREAA